jgi:hypothetical protein
VKLDGKYREVYNPITKQMVGTKWPMTRELATAEGVAFFYPAGTPECPTHRNGSTSKVFVISGLMPCCARDQAHRAYKEAEYLGEPLGHPGAATECGIDYYWVQQHGSYCGHVGKRTLDGKCWTCEQERMDSKNMSPRQIALKDGEVWYTPAHGDECRKCGALARRRVANGSCEECETRAKIAAGKQIVKEVSIRDICPDLVISRADAIAAGFKIFRTGKPCHKGHTGWRYIATGGCLDCKAG